MHLLALEQKFDLDWIKIVHDDPCAPREVYVDREYTHPRVDFSYRGKRYFAYIPVKIKVDTHSNLWHTRVTHSEDYSAMEESLLELLTKFVEDNGYQN